MKGLWLGAYILCLTAAAATQGLAKPRAGGDAPTPPGVTKQLSDTDGVVYADAKGHTLYTSADDKPGESVCDDTHYLKATRTLSPVVYYLPDADTRPTCIQSWPPLVASDGAKPVGDWTVIKRADGVKQWAFHNRPVYRSILDEVPGDVNGMTTGPSDHVRRTPVTADLGLPPGVTTRMTKWGRVLAPDSGNGVLYTREGAQKADCDSVCQGAWRPLAAPAMAQAHGDWSIVATGRGFNQWAYKGKPLFAAVRLRDDLYLPPEEAPGWKPAVYEALPIAPSDITVQRTAAGLAYADKHGHTVYFFSCIDETPDHQYCDVLGTTPINRLTLCGGPAKCMRTWRPVLASPGARSPNRTWTVIKVDRKTGGRIADNRRDGLSAWAYRGRPIYTFDLDKEPGDAYGDGVRNVGMMEVQLLNLEFSPADRELR